MHSLCVHVTSKTVSIYRMATSHNVAKEKATLENPGQRAQNKASVSIQTDILRHTHTHTHTHLCVYKICIHDRPGCNPCQLQEARKAYATSPRDLKSYQKDIDKSIGYDPVHEDLDLHNAFNPCGDRSWCPVAIRTH